MERFFMGKTFDNMYSSIRDLGVDDSLPFADRRRIYLTNVFSLFAGGFTLLYMPFYCGWGMWGTFFAAIINVLGFTIGVMLNARKKYLSAKFIIVFSICLLLFTHGLEVGRESFVQMIFIPVIMGMIPIFDSRKVISFIIAVSLPILCLLSLEFIQYKGLDLIEPKVEKAQFLYYANLFTTIAGSILILRFFTLTFEDQTDLLERQAAKLNDSKETMIQTFQIARIGFSEVDLEKRIANWGPGLKKIIGVPPDFVPTIDMFLEMVHPDDLERIKSSIEETISKGKEFVRTYRLIRPADKEVIYLKSNGRVICNASGKPVKLFAVIRDITEDKAQEALIRSEKERAEAADLAKSLFLSNISHEIRTPLHGLLGFAKLLEKSPLDGEQREFLSMMQYSGDTLMALLNDILDLTRIEMGKVELKKEHFKVQKLLDNCLPLYELQARKKGLDFSCVSVMKDSDVIYADPLRIKQIIINLVTNAIKYTTEGEIKVQLSLLEQMDTHGLKSLQITVEDTGEGIPPTFQEEVFNSFTQLNRERNSAIKGLGLGLAIVKNLVKYLGGNIQINSPRTPDTQYPGTRFVISLPVEKGFLRPALEPVSNSALSQFPFLKVLVAEDNIVNQILAQKVLEDLGAQVKVVENGQEAVDFVKDSQVDIVMMDIKMPIMNGYEATRQIRHIDPNLPIIALSANAYKEDKEASFEAGMNGHISKPFLPEELFKAIEKLRITPSQR